jgi:hypothetical protein
MIAEQIPIFLAFGVPMIVVAAIALALLIDFSLPEDPEE